MTIEQINDMIYQLEKKIQLLEKQKESLLISFVNEFSMENLHIVKDYDKAIELLDTCLSFIKKRQNDLFHAKKLIKVNKNE